jgi:hypothetical protein
MLKIGVFLCVVIFHARRATEGASVMSRRFLKIGQPMFNLEESKETLV